MAPMTARKMVAACASIFQLFADLTDGEVAQRTCIFVCFKANDTGEERIEN